MKKNKLKETLIKELDLILESEASDWDTLYNWLNIYTRNDNKAKSFLYKHHIINGTWLKKVLDSGEVTIDQIDELAKNPEGQSLSDLSMYKRLMGISEETGTGAIGVGAGPISTSKWVMPKGEKTNPGTKAMEKLGFKKIVQEIVREQLKSYKQTKYVK
jgi:hypothetical protein